MMRYGPLAAATLAIVLIMASSVWPQKPGRPTTLPLPHVGEVWRIEKIADISPPLRHAIDRVHCRLDESVLHELPIQIFRPAPRPVIAIIPCPDIIGYGRAFLLDRDATTEPKLLSLPTFAFPSGFGTTDMPGVLDWNAAARTLTATRGNDVGGNDETRLTYRYDSGQSNWFTLIRVETRKCCPGTADPAWTSIWEASPWPRLHL
jgi:hypothetical protein